MSCMTPEQLRAMADEMTYLKTVKKFILSDARAYYYLYGFTSPTITYDITTSSFISGGKTGFQATLIAYHYPVMTLAWQPLAKGSKCHSLVNAMRTLWEVVQCSIGEVQMQMAQRQYQASLPAFHDGGMGTEYLNQENRMTTEGYGEGRRNDVQDDNAAAGIDDDTLLSPIAEESRAETPEGQEPLAVEE